METKEEIRENIIRLINNGRHDELYNLLKERNKCFEIHTQRIIPTYQSEFFEMAIAKSDLSSEIKEQLHALSSDDDISGFYWHIGANLTLDELKTITIID